MAFLTLVFFLLSFRGFLIWVMCLWHGVLGVYKKGLWGSTKNKFRMANWDHLGFHQAGAQLLFISIFIVLSFPALDSDQEEYPKGQPMVFCYRVVRLTTLFPFRSRDE